MSTAVEQSRAGTAARGEQLLSVRDLASSGKLLITLWSLSMLDH